MRNVKRIFKVVCAVLLLSLLAGCGTASAQPSSVPVADALPTELVSEDEMEEIAQVPIRPGTLASTDMELASGQDVTITDPGIYRMSGTYDNITITVNVSEENIVSLVLDNLTILNADRPIIYVESAGSVVVSPYTGSENTLTVSSEITENDGKNNAVIYSKDDLEIGGTGTLNITGQNSDGIKGNDDIFIHDCVLNVSAGEKGIKANETLRIESGTLTIDSEEDALHSDNEIVIAGGNIQIRTGDDGIHADNAVAISAGTVSMEECYEGIEAMNVIISGGTVSIYAKDDGINAVASESEEQETINNMQRTQEMDGALNPMSGNMPQPPDMGGTPPDGMMPQPPDMGGTPPDGMQPPPGGMQMPGRNGAEPTQRPDGNRDMSQGRPSQGGNFGGGMFASDGSIVSISGGKVYVNANGDGIDSNGDLLIFGGEIYVDGSANGGNGALDFNANGKITGGTLIAVGYSAMAENFKNAEIQAAVMYSFNKTYEGGELIEVKNESGDVLCSMTAAKAFQSVVFSSPDIKVGENYLLTIDDDEYTISVTDNVQNFGNASRMPA